MNGAAEKTRFTTVAFSNFKAFSRFTVKLGPFNILVGPNNAGKSTVLVAFRILAAAMRRAEARKAELVNGPGGRVLGHKVDLSAISVAEENIFHNYDDESPASVTFSITGGNRLVLYFPEQGTCNLIPETDGRSCATPAEFKRAFNCKIGFVPILGPVEHNEILFEPEAARLALFNFRAARNFRNIWHHFPEKFEEFRSEIRRTWPGMDIEPPEIDRSHEKPRLFMYCPEERRPREIAWAGFGFQVWCQMLTHIIQSSDASLFLIDEPDIYLHSDLQRQLVGILRELGPDIIIATHSVEIISDADTEEILVINKKKASAQRIRSAEEIGKLFKSLGSNVNPVLTQVAKTRRVLFLEGQDFLIISRFARRLGDQRVSSRSDFGVVQLEGFSVERAKTLKRGMEATLGLSILSACLLDRDYRSDVQCADIESKMRECSDVIRIHHCKEIENFLLIPKAIDRSVRDKLRDREARGGKAVAFSDCAESILYDFSEEKRHYVLSQYLSFRRAYERERGSIIHEEAFNQEELKTFEKRWSDPAERLMIIPGKDALSYLNSVLQDRYQVSVTPTSIVESAHIEEIPSEMRLLVSALSEFVAMKV